MKGGRHRGKEGGRKEGKEGGREGERSGGREKGGEIIRATTQYANVYSL